MNQGVRHTPEDLAPLEEERTVVSRIQNGDHQAFEQLYRWYADLLFRQVIWPRLPIRELAEDCLRETLHTTLEKIDQFQNHDRSIFFWMRRISINKAHDLYRRHQRQTALAEKLEQDPTQEMGSAPPRPDRGLEVEDTRRMVETSLSRLNPRYARALRLRLIEERTRAECAEAFGISAATFDVLLYRASKAFRKEYPP